MTRQYTTSIEILAGLEEDVLWLLITIYAFVSQSKFERISTMSREDLVVDAILLDSACRDIIARLTALDDKDSRSFQTLMAAANREGLDKSRSRKLKERVDSYRATINDLKVAHRNSYIAHVRVDAEVKPRIFDDPVGFNAAASAAVNLLDDFAGRCIAYTFKISSTARIDLREALSARSRS